MPDSHPTRDALGQFILGQLSPIEMRDIAWHLLNGCADCQAVTSTLWEPADSFEEGAAVLELAASPEEEADEYDEVLDRVFEKVAATEAGLAEQRDAGCKLFAELMQVPPERQHLLLTNSPRFRKRMLCELLIEESHENGFQDPRRAVE